VVAIADGALGLNVGYWAMARTLPVCGCITTIEQLRALAFFTSCRHACSASYWMLALIVRLRFFAGTGAVTLSVVLGIGTPSVPVSTSSLPSRPASRELYSSSSPASPVRSPALLVSVKPIRLAASSPLGYERV
jgi:hypothetical protein